MPRYLSEGSPASDCLTSRLSSALRRSRWDYRGDSLGRPSARAEAECFDNFLSLSLAASQHPIMLAVGASLRSAPSRPTSSLR